jgi:hypothetical protein
MHERWLRELTWSAEQIVAAGLAKDAMGYSGRCFWISCGARAAPSPQTDVKAPARK